MILSEEFEIKKTENLTSGYIEDQFKQLGVEPLRWAIVNIGEENYIVSVSHEKK